MGAPSDDHKFNDDLLLHEEDRRLALMKYPSIFHVLDHAELRQLFSKYDVPANRAKHTGLIAGIWAIGLGFWGARNCCAGIALRGKHNPWPRVGDNLWSMRRSEFFDWQCRRFVGGSKA